MSEGKNAFENTVKGMFNRLRSAPGETVEDIAYFLNDTIPEDAPGKAMRWLKNNAENVVENNTAGSIGDISTFQFGKARENGADENLVKIMDEVSKELGYNIFGLKLGNYIEPLGEGFNVYRDLREQGYSKDEAAEKTILALGYSFGTEMLFDKGEKWLLNRFKIKNGGGTNGIVAKADDILPDVPKKSTITERIEKGEISTKIISGRQNKHIEGTKQYKDKYKDGANPQDVLTISMEEAQELVDRYCGKGDPGKSDMNGTWTEFMDADHVIGKYYSNGEYHETKRFTIHYSKKGAHVIPVRPKEAMKK